MFEFKLVPAPAIGAAASGPLPSRWRRRRPEEDDPLTLLTTTINLCAAAGWDYAGSEIVPVTRRPRRG